MSELLNVADIFGEDVFNDTVMQARLPKKVYKDLKKTIEEGKYGRTGNSLYPLVSAAYGSNSRKT